MCTRIAMSIESAGNLGSCGSPRVIRTFCNPRLCTRLRKPRKYSGTTSSAMMRPWGPTVGESRTIIAAACANVCDRHAGFDAKPTYQLARFTGTIALLFVVTDWADNVGDWASGIGKGGSRRARSRQEFLSAD